MRPAHSLLEPSQLRVDGARGVQQQAVLAVLAVPGRLHVAVEPHHSRVEGGRLLQLARVPGEHREARVSWGGEGRKTAQRYTIKNVSLKQNSSFRERLKKKTLKLLL